ncbi:MAG: nucleoside recognition domain-containing protein, partial [Tannerella sp.]|nr:nucleoside recognition domain-containing protein [Tannerella sp.]
MPSETKTNLQRIGGCVRRALPSSGHTCLWLLKIILPISLAVRLLQYSGLLERVSSFLEPVFSLVGLPGSTVIVFLTSIFCPLYAPLALITSMSLGLREATILALMCLVSHNLPVEASVQSKTGSRFWEMIVFRISMSFIIAFCLNRVLPHGGWGTVGVTASAVSDATLRGVLELWFLSSMKLILTIALIVTSLLILHGILDEYRLLPRISRFLRPLMRVFGLPEDTAFPWLIANLVGIAYGSAIIIEQVRAGKLSYRNGNLLNYHLSVSHSLLEDTLIFVSIGVPVLWIVGTRL